MTEATWEKPVGVSTPVSGTGNRLKFLIGGLLILGAAAYLLISGTASGAKFFITIAELKANAQYVGQSVRISGAVIGDSIQYDERNLIIEFTIADLPAGVDNLADALHQAVSDPNAEQIAVRVENQVKPDLLQHEAQAILTGTLDANGIFHANELLLKCPSRFEEAKPDESIIKPAA